MDYIKAPKIELHLHLDCSLSYEVVRQIDPSISFEAYASSFIAPPKCTDLIDYLTRAVKGFELMQTEEQLRLVTADLFSQLAEDNVIYAEIRFAPLQHISQGLDPFDVVRIVNESVVEGIRQTGIEAGIILCTLRHFTEMQSMETIRLVERFKGSQVVGFDIAGDEAGYPIDAHVRAFQYARHHQIPCTAHAGEACGAERVWETLQHCYPLRIGHGVRSAEDQTLLDHLVKKNIHLEVCPTSNVQTNIYPGFVDHAIDRIYRHGVSLSINTDGRTTSNVTLAEEYGHLEKVFQWNTDHFLRCNLEAIEHAFTSKATKERLRSRILDAYRPHVF